MVSQGPELVTVPWWAPPSDQCWAQCGFTAVFWAGAEMTSPGEPCPWPESPCKEDCFTLWHTWRIIYAAYRSNLNIWEADSPAKKSTLRISKKKKKIAPYHPRVMISISVFHFNWSLVPLYAFLSNVDVCWFLLLLLLQPFSFIYI